MRKGLFIAILFSLSLFFAPRMHAIDPVTIAILTPIAIKGAKVAAPYVWRGLQNGGRHGLQIGEDMLDLLRLPMGMLQATVGAPFGTFKKGLKNIGQGCIAPLALTLDCLMLPLALTGMNFNP